jgi:hypothetical protein
MKSSVSGESDPERRWTSVPACLRAVDRMKPGRNGIALAARHHPYLVRRLRPEREKRLGGADDRMTYVDVRGRRMEDQLAPCVAAGKVLWSLRIEKITIEIRRSRVRSRVSGVLPSWWATKKPPVS